MKDAARRLEQLRSEAWRETARDGKRLVARAGETTAAFVRLHPWMTVLGAGALAVGAVSTFRRAGTTLAPTRRRSRVVALLVWALRAVLPTVMSSLARPTSSDDEM
ncbi:MAG: hypothetical protein K8S98_06275 [Planctomycetes bacterium]|nr:hypothetical protein [Planctomycetota bacterium]